MTIELEPMRADEIPRLRRRLNWTSQQLADELGISKVHLLSFNGSDGRMRRVYGLALRYIELHYLGGPER